MLVRFPPYIRRLAMGPRQTSIPLAGVFAAATLPAALALFRFMHEAPRP